MAVSKPRLILAAELWHLDELKADGLLSRTGDSIEVPERGRPFVRNSRVRCLPRRVRDAFLPRVLSRLRNLGQPCARKLF